MIICIIWGFFDGAIRQIGTLAGIIVALFLANKLGASVASLLGIGGGNANTWGYIIVLVLSLVGVIFLAYTLRKIVSAVGLGLFDKLAGATISGIKCALLLSICLNLFGMLNNAVTIVKPSTIKNSLLYEPMNSITQYVSPAIDWANDKISTK